MIIKWQKVILFVLLCFLVFFSTYHLTESPSVWFDEGIVIQLAANLAGTGINGLQVAPGNIEHFSIMTVGYPLVYPLALLFKIFGVSVLVARSLMVAFIVGFVVAGYFLMKRLFGLSAALGAVALLTTFPPLYANGKNALGEVPGLFFFLLALLFFNIAWSHRDKAGYWFAGAGVFLGLCVSTKPTFLVFLPAVAIALFISWRKKDVSVKHICLLVLGLAIPLIIWFITQFGPDASLYSVVSFYANPYKVGNLSDLIVSNLRLLVTGAGPLYLLMMVFVWSLALVRRKFLRQNIAAEEMISYLAVIFFLISFLRLAGWYRYLFPAQAIALLYFPIAFLAVIGWVAQKFSIIGRWRQASLFVVIGLLSVWGVHGLLFNSWVADFYSSHKTAFWQDYFAGLPAKEIVFFYHTPEVVIFSKQQNYYQYLDPAGYSLGKEQLSVIDEGGADKIIVETDAFQIKKEWFLRRYHVAQEAYKYSILEKN